MWPFKKKKKEQARRFQGAVQSRLVDGWIAGQTSLDSEIKSSLKGLRNRARELHRNNDFAKAIFRTIVNNVVGDGVKFQSQVRMLRGGKLNDYINDQIEWAWYRWCKKGSCDTTGKHSFADLEKIIVENLAESGEILVRKINKPFGNSKIPFALEVIEADYLDDDYNEIAKNGNEVRMGVEFDSWQRPVAYHFLDRHPGDGEFANRNKLKGKRTRVPADEILHLFISKRSKQTRGIPWLHSAMMSMHQIEGFITATVIKARAGACQMGFIVTPDGELPSDGVVGEQRITEAEPGKWTQLNPGETIVPYTPNTPGGEYEPFVKNMLKRIAAGCGVSYAAVSGDYSDNNYSGTRQELIPERDHWRIIQLWLVDNLHQPIFEAWLEQAILAGQLPIDNYFSQPEMYHDFVRWLPRGWKWVDPMKDIEASKAAIRAGLSTHAIEVAQTGEDFEEICATLAREKQIAEQYELTFDTDPSKDASGNIVASEDPETSVAPIKQNAKELENSSLTVPQKVAS